MEEGGRRFGCNTLGTRSTCAFGSASHHGRGRKEGFKRRGRHGGAGRVHIEGF